MTDIELLEQILDGQKQIHSRLDTLETETRHTRILVESELTKHIQTIAEQHGDIIKRLDALADYPDTRGRVATLEHVVKSHTQDISKLKKVVG